MRTASRFMPRRSVTANPWYWAPSFWGLLALVAGVLAWARPWHLVGTVAAVTTGVVAAWLMQRREAKRLQQLAAQRPGESLCSFTRAFAWRKIDTWIIRAVYEELQEYLQGAGGFPLRAQDHLLRDLGLDAEEVDLYVVEAIAKRTGRSLQHYERNPYFGKVEQVADLVLFFAAQPKA